jgi:lactoylglutathione lyase
MDAPVATPDFDPKYWIAGTDATTSRILHTMMRIADPERALRFYVEGLGMTLVYTFDIEQKRLTGYFLSFDANSTDGFLELAHYWDVGADYSHGSGYGHIAVGAPDLHGLIAKLAAMGVEVVKEPYILFPGGPQLAMVRDPDGYMVELIQARRD